MDRLKSNYFDRPMDEHRTYSFLRALKFVYGKEKKKAVDLGAGHCKFTDIASVFFKEVHAVDSRDVRVPKSLPENVTFIKANAVEHDLSDYDVIICLGLLYHLTAKEQISIFKKAFQKELIIDTHMAIEPNDISEGFNGSFYQEAENKKEMMKNPKASTTTLKSFWFEETEFVRMLKDIGYMQIIKFEPEHYPKRTFYYIR